MAGMASRGALRDPGLWSGTALRFAPLTRTSSRGTASFIAALAARDAGQAHPVAPVVHDCMSLALEAKPGPFSVCVIHQPGFNRSGSSRHGREHAISRGECQESVMAPVSLSTLFAFYRYRDSIGRFSSRSSVILVRASIRVRAFVSAVAREIHRSRSRLPALELMGPLVQRALAFGI